MNYRIMRTIAIFASCAIGLGFNSSQVYGLETGWFKDASGNWIFVDDNGQPLKSTWLTENGKRYCFDENGYMRKGWYQEQGYWYYFDSSGAAKTKWLLNNNNWYAFNQKSQMITGWYQDVDGNWYYLSSPDGHMLTGWIHDNGKDYFLDNSGAMKIGWLKYNDGWYYFNKDGSLLKSSWMESTDENGVPCKVYLDSTGKWTDSDYSNTTPNTQNSPAPEKTPDQESDPVSKPNVPTNPVPDTQTDAVTDPTPDIQPDTATDPTPDIQPETTTDPMPDIQPEPETESHLFPIKSYLIPQIVESGIRETDTGRQDFYVVVKNPNPDCYIVGLDVTCILRNNGDIVSEEIIYLNRINPLGETFGNLKYWESHGIPITSAEFTITDENIYWAQAYPVEGFDTSIEDNINISYEIDSSSNYTNELKCRITNNTGEDLEHVKIVIDHLFNGKVYNTYSAFVKLPKGETVLLNRNVGDFTNTGPYEIRVYPDCLHANHHLLNWYPIVR